MALTTADLKRSILERDAEISRVRAQIGRLIDWLDAENIVLSDDDTLVCVPASLLRSIVDRF